MVHSVQDRTVSALAREIPVVMYFASAADNFPAWPSLARDVSLDAFWRTEYLLSGAVYSMVAKIAALDFKVRGPRKSVARTLSMLRSADFGGGWLPFVQKVTQDVLTQDNGGFVELIRASGAAPTAPVEAIAHIDAQKCERTGNPEQPINYEDGLGHVHRLRWFEVVPLCDLPSSRERDVGWGYCACSRVLRAAQILRDVATYKREKLQGKRTPAILLVQGIRQGAVEAALSRQRAEEEMTGRTLYSGPALIAAPDPGMPVDAKLIELAGLPDGYNEDVLFKWYIVALALAFGTDYSEFAPLPGGNLGTASQVEVMSSRARGKGSGILLQMFEYMLNYNILPATQEFQFSSTDPEAEVQRVKLRHDRARERALRVNSGEITPQQALMLAVAEGDAPEEFLRAGMAPGDADRIETVVRSTQEMQDAYDLVELSYHAGGASWV
jgi:hypothetical protein